MECNNTIQNIEIYERKVGQRRIEQDNEDKSSLHCTVREGCGMWIHVILKESDLILNFNGFWLRNLDPVLFLKS